MITLKEKGVCVICHSEMVDPVLVSISKYRRLKVTNYGNSAYKSFGCRSCVNKRVSESVRSWRAKNPDKVSAHRKVFIEKRAGRLKSEPCFCGENKTEAHHSDYSKPLEVTWLCKKHHNMLTFPS